MKLLIDGDALAKGHAYFQLGGVAHSPDHRGLPGRPTTRAPSTTRSASAMWRAARISPMSFPTRPAARSGPRTGAPSTTCNSTRSTGRRGSICTGSAPPVAEDRLVYEENGQGLLCQRRRAAGAAASPRSAPVITRRRKCGSSISPDAGCEPRGSSRRARRASATTSSIIRRLTAKSRSSSQTNADGAEDFKIVTAPLGNSGPRELARTDPAPAGHAASSTSPCLRDWLVRLERDRRPAAHRRAPRSPTAPEHTIAFDEEAYSLGFVPASSSSPTTLRFTYSSMTTPSEVWDYDMQTRAARAAQAPGNSLRPRSGALRHAAHLRDRAKDGETVPISLLHRRDTKIDGTAPLPALRLRCVRHRNAGAVSAPTGYHSSIAASSMRSRICAAAPRRAGAGTAKASSHKRKTPFRDFVACGRASDRGGIRARPAASSLMAARPAAC